MNILHVIRDMSPETGGPVTAIRGLAEAQAAYGHKVRIASTDYGMITGTEIPGVNIELFACKQSHWRYSSAFGESLPTYIQVADIVHLHMLWEYPTWKAARLCLQLKKPYIIRPCGMLDRWSLRQSSFKKSLYLKIMLNGIFARASGFHFTSLGEKNHSPQFGEVDKSFVVPLGVLELLPKNIEKNILFAEYPHVIEKRLILFLSRIHYKKRPEIAIKAFAKMQEGISDVLLVMAGPCDEKYLQKLKSLCLELHIQDKVIFTGMLDHSEVIQMLSIADIFILPSYQENFGIAVVEAMAAGCPVIVSDKIDLASEIDKYGAGISCPADTESFATAMSELLLNPDRLVVMSNNGKQLVSEKYTWRRVVEQLDAEYSRIIG